MMMPIGTRLQFVVESRRFIRMVEGIIRHYVTSSVLTEGDRVVFYQDGTNRTAIFLVTHVDVHYYDDTDNVTGEGEFTIYTASLKLQEWASPDTI